MKYSCLLFSQVDFVYLGCTLDRIALVQLVDRTIVIVAS